jgi:cytoskeletal protein CcmA (bactofilin family)
MLNKKNEKTGISSSELNFISSGTQINGDLFCDKDLRMDGYVKGNLKVEAKLVIGKAGKVEGTLQVQNADISGEIIGNLIVNEALILRETARVHGDIQTVKITIENGAVFNGSCIMSKNNANKTNTSNSQSVVASTPENSNG